MGYRLVVVHLVDAHYCSDPSKYISVLLIALRSMLQLDLPHINVLSKIDLINQYGPLAFNLEFYTDVQDLSHLIPALDADPRMKKFAALNTAICDLVESFGLVGFETLCVEDKNSMTHLLQAIDRAGGYAFGEAEGGGDNIWTVAMRENWGGAQGNVQDIQERWIDERGVYDKHEEKMRIIHEKERAREARRRVMEAGDYMESESEDEEEEGKSEASTVDEDEAITPPLR